MSKQEEERFLKYSSEDDTLHEEQSDHVAIEHGAKARVWRARFGASFAVNIVLFVGIAAFALLRPHALSSNNPFMAVEDTWSPANDAVKYEYRNLFRDTDALLFAGPPRPESNQAWRNLLAGTLIRISEDELDQAGLTSIELSEGGYAAGLGVSHNLHCLKRVKQAVYADDFWPNRTSEMTHQIMHHADHCIETLRQALMCQGDHSLYTLRWMPHNHKRPAVVYGNRTKCVDWSRLSGWMQDRAAKQQELILPEEWQD